MQLSFKIKVIALAVFAALLPLLVTLVLTVAGKSSVMQEARDELNALARSNIAQIVKDVYGMCEICNELTQLRLDQGLKAANKIVAHAGGIALDKEQRCAWNATNQETDQNTSVVLPLVTVGGQWLGQNRNFSTAVIVVDEVRDITGMFCTIFQRMNEQGDMLRVASNVIAPDGNRGTGTYIPALRPDGTPTPVVGSVMAGRTYRGMANVVGQWQLTSYEPIVDETGTIIGMLFVGLTMDALDTLRRAIINTQVGKTGYVWVVGGRGKAKGRYIISKGGERDDEDIWNTVDSDGCLFVQLMVNTALGSPVGDINYNQYPWQNPGDAKPRTKLAAFTYFEPWDWVVGAGVYEDDYFDACDKVIGVMNLLLRRLRTWSMVVLVLVAGLAVLLGFRITRPLGEITAVANQIADGDLKRASESLAAMFAFAQSDPAGRGRDEIRQLAAAFTRMTRTLNSLIGQVQRSGIQVTTSSTQIAASSRQIDGTVAEQASSTNQVTASAKEILATSQELAKTMESVASVASRTAGLAANSRKGLQEMEGAMRQLMEATGSISTRLSAISEKANNIETIVVTITKVADQTNLLSLNAAIEAEKAGEYGLGFSVVAGEIRRLADQTAVATLDIERMVKEMHSAVSSGVMETDKFVAQVRRGVEDVGGIAEQLAGIIEQVQTLGPRFQEVSEGMRGQSTGAEQISQAMVQLSESARQTKDSLREFSQAAEELAEAVRGLRKEVSQFEVG